MPWDITNDAAVFDGTEAVSLHRIERGEVVETLEVLGVLRGPLVRRAAEAAAAGVALAPEEVAFHLPAAALAGRAPRMADVIRDAAGREYTVLEAVLASRGTRWICRSRLARHAD